MGAMAALAAPVLAAAPAGAVALGGVLTGTAAAMDASEPWPEDRCPLLVFGLGRSGVACECGGGLRTMWRIKTVHLRIERKRPIGKEHLVQNICQRGSSV